MGEIRLMKGNEAIAEAAIRAGADAYFGYPITPQSEILEYLMSEKPHERTGMVVLQAESEIGAINMVFGAASTGKKAITSSSSPGITLKMEGISYLAGAELPCVVVNVARGGPGLGTIQPSQADYFQATKGGGHGDYHMIVLTPNSVQEMSDFVKLAFDLAFKYRNPVMILTDGVIGQMMEKVELFDPVPRTNFFDQTWVATGKTPDRQKNVVTSLNLDPYVHEKYCQKIQAKYREIELKEVRCEKIQCNDAEYIFVAYGIGSRICEKAVRMAREKGYKVGLLRPQTVYPFPYKEINKLADQLKSIITVEMSSGQMIEDVKLAVNGKLEVDFYGRMGGVIATPEEIYDYFISKYGK